MQNNGPAAIAWIELSYAAALLLITLALSAWLRLGLASSIVLGGLRATVQLILVSHILLWIFEHNEPHIVLAVLVIMTLAAGFTASARLPGSLWRKRSLTSVSTMAIFLGSALTLAYTDAVVIPFVPWYHARYLIPIYGMVVANAMNAAALAAERLGAEIDGRRDQIETLLALGASVSQAVAEPTRRALVAAMTPAINALSVVGIVSLPGMMTGQIIAGTDPTLAVRYQLVVVFMLTSASALTATAVVIGYRRQFFSSAAQLMRAMPGA